jgi:hypothetical protein
MNPIQQRISSIIGTIPGKGNPKCYLHTIKKLSEDKYCGETIELKLEEFELHRNTIF